MISPCTKRYKEIQIVLYPNRMAVCKIDVSYQKVLVKGKHASCLWSAFSFSHEQINIPVMVGVRKLAELCNVII